VDTLTLFVVGLGLLIVGAELLVRGASGLASRVGISPLVIGLTVMAFGTTHHATRRTPSLPGTALSALGSGARHQCLPPRLIQSTSPMVKLHIGMRLGCAERVREMPRKANKC